MSSRRATKSAVKTGKPSASADAAGSRLVRFVTEAFSYRLVQQLLLVSLSGVNTVSKLALSFYTARYLGLAELGVYGLLTGAATIVPATLGFGLTDYVGRHLVGLKSRQAVPLIATRLALTVLIHLVGIPIAWFVNSALGMPVPQAVFFLVAGILLLAHLAIDIDHILTLRGHVYFANMLAFINSGLWPPVVIAWGLLHPEGQSLENLLLGWFCALCFSWLILTVRLFMRRRWRFVSLKPRWIVDSLRPSFPFYLNNLNFVGSLYIDRFVVAAFLGLELTGVYTFFWSVANAMHLLAFVITHPYMGKLVAAGRNVDLPEFRRLEHRLVLEMMSWAFFLGTCATIAMQFLLPFMEQPLLEANQELVWILLIATLGRLLSEIYGFILYALHRDRAYVATSIAGTVVSVLLNAALIPLAGLDGAAAAFMLTYLLLLALRAWLSRQTDSLAGSVAGSRQS